MSYCVRCGVELDDALKECPLCHTPVLLPVNPDQEEEMDPASRAWPDHVPSKRKHRPNLVPPKPVVLLATFLLLIPFLVTLFVDLKAHGEVTWSFYPMTSLALLWLMVAYPALLRRHTLSVAFTVDMLATALFLVSLDQYADGFVDWAWYPASSLVLIWLCGMMPVWLGRFPPLVAAGWFVCLSAFLWEIEWLTGSGPWFLPLALPLAVLVSLFGLGCWLGFRFIRARLVAVAAAVFLTTALLFLVDGLTQRFVTGSFLPLWSPVVVAVGVPLGALLLVVHRSPELRAFLLKKFHI